MQDPIETRAATRWPPRWDAVEHPGVLFVCEPPEHVKYDAEIAHYAEPRPDRRHNAGRFGIFGHIRLGAGRRLDVAIEAVADVPGEPRMTIGRTFAEVDRELAIACLKDWIVQARAWFDQQEAEAAPIASPGVRTGGAFAGVYADATAGTAAEIAEHLTAGLRTSGVAATRDGATVTIPHRSDELFRFEIVDEHDDDGTRP